MAHSGRDTSDELDLLVEDLVADPSSISVEDLNAKPGNPGGAIIEDHGIAPLQPGGLLRSDFESAVSPVRVNQLAVFLATHGSGLLHREGVIRVGTRIYRGDMCLEFAVESMEVAQKMPGVISGFPVIVIVEEKEEQSQEWRVVSWSREIVYGARVLWGLVWSVGEY